MIQITAEWAGVFIGFMSAITGLLIWAIQKSINQALLEHEIRIMRTFDERFVSRTEYEMLTSRMSRLEGAN